MSFRGFEAKYPVYDCICPQSHHTISVRTLTVQDEERLKGSFVSPVRITEHLNRCIWDCTTEKPKDIPDFDTFLKQITLKDREAILYALYHISYDEIRNYDIKCKQCKKEYQVSIKASDTFSINPYPMDDIIGKKIDLQLPMMKEITVSIIQPTLFHEIEVLKQYSTRAGLNIEVITETLMISSFKQEKQTGEPEVYEDRVEIIDLYRSLPARDKKFIHRNYNDIFGKYAMELKMKSFCTGCGSEEEVTVDLTEQFFRMVLSS